MEKKNDSGNAIAIDPNGYVYTTGYFSGTADFDPGEGSYELSALDDADIFVSKLDLDGNFRWAKQMVGGKDDSGNSIAIDSNGNVYTTGYFSGTVDFDPGNTKIVPIIGEEKGGAPKGSGDVGGDTTKEGEGGGDGGGPVPPEIIDATSTYELTSLDGTDAFISKLDSDGNFVWAKQISGVGDDSGNSIALDSNDNAYIAGYFSGTADFNPGDDVYELTPEDGTDAFISKLDSDGNFVWAKQLGGGINDSANSISLDSNDNAYITGYFSGEINHGLGENVHEIISEGGMDIFIEKLDSEGNFAWIKQIGGTGKDSGNSVKVDSAGNNIYTTGYFYDTANFNIGGDVYNQISSGLNDAFVLKLTKEDTTPEAFIFTSQQDVEINTVVESDMITISGINSPAQISITSCTSVNCEYSINDQKYTSDEGTISNGDTVKVRQTSSGLNETTTGLILDIGGVTGEFNITTHKSGGTTSISDTIPPVITLLGLSPIDVLVGEEYVDKGAMAIDNIDGDITESITTTNNVNTKVPGTYKVTYNVKDKAGNAAFEVQRIVNVTKENEKSISSANKNDSVSFDAATKNIEIITPTAKEEALESQNENKKLEANNNIDKSDDIAVNGATVSAPVFSTGKVLKVGTIHNEVKELQKFLNNIGYVVSKTGAGSPGKETNYFGTLTKKALMEFQKDHKIVSDGILGNNTKKEINKTVK